VAIVCPFPAEVEVELTPVWPGLDEAPEPTGEVEPGVPPLESLETDALALPSAVADPPPVLLAFDDDWLEALAEPLLPTEAVPELEELLLAEPVPDAPALPLAEALADSAAAMASEPMIRGPAGSNLIGVSATAIAIALIVAIRTSLDLHSSIEKPSALCSGERPMPSMLLAALRVMAERRHAGDLSLYGLPRRHFLSCLDVSSKWVC
jgi:hypothetical protein